MKRLCACDIPSNIKSSKAANVSGDSLALFLFWTEGVVLLGMSQAHRLLICLWIAQVSLPNEYSPCKWLTKKEPCATFVVYVNCGWSYQERAVYWLWRVRPADVPPKPMNTTQANTLHQPKPSLSSSHFCTPLSEVLFTATSSNSYLLACHGRETPGFKLWCLISWVWVRILVVTLAT